MKWLFILFVLYFLASPVNARITPNDTYQVKRESFQKILDDTKDVSKRNQLISADKALVQINQGVCIRFEGDINKLGALMEELKRRLDLDGKPTVVAYGATRNQIESADYWVNFAAEAVAYQKSQDYTPLVSISASKNELKGDLQDLAGKILHAKVEVTKALIYEK